MSGAQFGEGLIAGANRPRAANAILSAMSSPVPAPFPPDREADYAKVCATARSNFSHAVDLVLIHNEQTVCGPQPRASLNPLTVLLAVAAWERFIADLDALQKEGPSWKGPGRHNSRAGGAYLWSVNPDKHVEGPAVTLLAAITEGRLPAAWRLRNFGGWRGAAPTQPHDLTGSELVAPDNVVDKAIRLRNWVAHHRLAQDEHNGPLYWSDAQSHTIQAGWARLVLGLFLQLTQQTMTAVAAAACYPASTKHQLDSSWFAAEAPKRLRGIDNPGPLWGGHSLYP